MPSLIQRLRDSAAHYRRFMFPMREVFPGRSVQRHVALLEEAADELDGKGKFDSIAWQGCLDHANKNAAAARADADRVRNQLFEAREQRDEARADARNGFWTIVSILDRVQKAEADLKSMDANYGNAITQRNKAETERDELRKALEASHREIAEARHYWANQGPHDHVVISLDGW